MLKDEFIELGGKAEDYEEANRIYTELDLWLDRHEFMTWYPFFGSEKYMYIELLNAVRTARNVSTETIGLYTLRETMLRYAQKEAEQTRKEIERLKRSLGRLETICDQLIKDGNIYNR